MYIMHHLCKKKHMKLYEYLEQLTNWVLLLIFIVINEMKQHNNFLYFLIFSNNLSAHLIEMEPSWNLNKKDSKLIKFSYFWPTKAAITGLGTSAMPVAGAGTAWHGILLHLLLHPPSCTSPVLGIVEREIAKLKIMCITWKIANKRD